MIGINRPEDIPLALQQMRRDAGLSQFALSERSGVAATDISKYERGVKTPGTAAIVKLVTGCGRRVVFMVDGNAR